MIKKPYEIKNLYKNYSYYLFYGKNEGAKKEEIEKAIIANKNMSVSKYDEKYILGNSENFLTEIGSGSLFENERIIINYATDKIIKIIEDISNKENLNILFIINADSLEKKSNLETYLKKRKDLFV